MSPFTRYGFSALVGLYGGYQLLNDHPVAGAIGLVLAGVIWWLGGRY
jgi:hypothetical protein